MDTFAYHRLIPQADGSYQLVLYLDFKTEIGKLPFEEITRHTDLLRDRVEKYIARQLPGVKIGSIRVMLGALVVSTFLMVYPGIASDADYRSNPSANPPSAQPPGNGTNEPAPPPTANPDPGTPQPPPTTEPTNPSPSLPPNYGTTLVLVNKQHSLSAQYVPANLVAPQVRFTFAEDLPQRYMQAEAAGALEKLFAQADQEGIELLAVSGYRSYQRQAEIFARNSAQSPDANRFSARPGQSEHQTGLAMDVTNRSLGTLTQAFGTTPEGRWLYANAARFGFIIRYPEGKEAITGYAYEPWHIRYVGVKAAQVIMASGITFEEYLGIRD